MQLKIKIFLQALLVSVRRFFSREDMAFVLLSVIGLVVLVASLLVYERTINEVDGGGAGGTGQVEVEEVERAGVENSNLESRANGETKRQDQGETEGIGTEERDLVAAAELVGQVGEGDSQATEYLWLEIAGAVRNPGLYLLKVEKGQNGRLYELVNLAGGFTRDANREYLDKELNLVNLVADGQKVYIPYAGETMPLVKVTTVGAGNMSESAGQAKGSDQAEGRISVNNAGINELKALVGVGDVRAAKIVEGRPYTSLAELVTEKIITQKILDDNQTQLSL